MKRPLLAGLAVSGLLLSTLTGVHQARATAPEGAVPASVQFFEPQHKALNLAAGTAGQVASWLRTPDGAKQARPALATAGKTPPVGTKRMWPVADFQTSQDYMQEFTLRGVGNNIEVWVATGPGPDGVMGTDMKPGDCRAALPNHTTVTDAQVQYLIHEYDTNILPKESKAFSVAPARDGSNAPQGDLKTTGLDFSGDGNKVVTLVENIRDPAWYNWPQSRDGVAGFFAPSFNDLTDRNIMTIDAEDWAHSTGPNPPSSPSQDPCKNEVGSPRFYESVFAHEYQHLLESYIDQAEENWVNEGLSMYAESLVGYNDATLTVDQYGFDAYIACFQGFRALVTKYNPAPVPCGGPANSLTEWGDQGTAKELLADYGNAESFMLYLKDRFGPAVLEKLHRDGKKQGLASLKVILESVKGSPKLADVLHDYQLMNLLDAMLERKDTKLTGVSRSLVSSKSLRAAVNLLNPAAMTPVGAGPNGADYLTLRGLGVGPLDGRQLQSFSFTGDRGLPPVPMQWTVAPGYPLPTIAAPVLPGLPATPPIDAPALPTGNPVLYSGNEPSTDASMVFAATVPEANPVLTYTSVYNYEQDFDYGYTMISTDGGKTYTALATATSSKGPLGPGFTGASPVPTPQIFDLSDYAGKKVLIAFRSVTDTNINNGGWAIDDVTVGGQIISDGSSTSPFRTITQIHPVPVQNWSLQLVGIDEVTHRVRVFRFSGKYAVTLTKAQIRALSSFPLLVAVIGFDDPGEVATVEAPYAVQVNGLGQAGGR
jgi:hypothetical protein